VGHNWLPGGNPVAGVDGVATANSSLYTSNGCTLSTAPAIFTSAWGQSHYTGCLTYDATYNAQPATTKNAFGQATSLTYDYTQGALPISATDANSQVTSTAYSYDPNGNRTVQVTQPLHSGSYTGKSSTNSSCAWNSTLPCFEIDTNSYLYSSAVTRTFYDSLGRKVETRTPGPGAGHDTIIFTVYNDQQHTSFQSVPFQVASGTGWVDPNGATDYQGVAPGGSVTYYDALGRPLAVQDPLFGSSQEPGIACSATLSGSYTACTNYGLGTVSGDTNTYATLTTVDPNKHVSVSFKDALGRSIYLQDDSGLFGGTLSVNAQKTLQYNVLNEPTQLSITDKAPQSGQTITSVTTSASYDDLGRLTSLTDPDRGTHTYSYDADGHLLTDVSGTRTIGANYDLLGRMGCIQNATPTINATGACSAGNPYVQNTYDVTKLGTQGSTDFPVGRLTQSVATTYFPEGTSATTTEKFQHDQRGRLITGQLALGLPSSWNVTTALPIYQLVASYNDADQVMTATTSTIPSGQGFTTTVAYDNTGALYGLSNNSTSTPNLATLVYNARAQLDTINFQTSTGSALAADQFGYDANLRPISATATWGSGSGSSGTILSQNRSYDNASNVISLSTTQAAVPGQSGSGGSETQNFCYDEQNRLVWAGNSGTQPGAGTGTCGSGTLSNSLSGAGYSNSYVYTHLGQLWQGPLSGGSTQYQYLYCGSSTPHQLTGLYPLGTTCASKSGQVYTSSYDAWGNVTSRYFSGTTATLSYDILDHFTKWNAGSTNQEWYVYDASGQRVLRRTTNSTSTTLRVYAFGLEEHAYSGTGTNQGNTYYYTLGDRLLGALDGNGTRFYLTDALGSILSNITNAAGGASVKGNQVFGPYGNARYFKGDINTAKGFTGQYNDSLTGLDYYNARYYDPVAGVFLSADSVMGNGSGANPYAYVGGNPETKNDPTGLAGCLPGEFCLIGGKPTTLSGCDLSSCGTSPSNLVASGGGFGNAVGAPSNPPTCLAVGCAGVLRAKVGFQATVEHLINVNMPTIACSWSCFITLREGRLIGTTTMSGVTEAPFVHCGLSPYECSKKHAQDAGDTGVRNAELALHAALAPFSASSKRVKGPMELIKTAQLRLASILKSELASGAVSDLISYRILVMATELKSSRT
jgi:RHS repeat-associated protein